VAVSERLVAGAQILKTLASRSGSAAECWKKNFVSLRTRRVERARRLLIRTVRMGKSSE
jgi:hypothetical protein